MSTTCRICLEEEGDMISPCLCKGTQKWVHRECLDHWMTVKPDLWMCDVCKSEYYRDHRLGATAFVILWLLLTLVVRSHWLVYPVGLPFTLLLAAAVNDTLERFERAIRMDVVLCIVVVFMATTIVSFLVEFRGWAHPPIMNIMVVQLLVLTPLGVYMCWLWIEQAARLITRVSFCIVQHPWAASSEHATAPA